jgi:NADPH2:quinone reductase
MSMRRLRIDRSTGAGRLVTERADIPEPGPGEISIDVAYAGLNLKDAKQRDGASTASRSEVTLPGFEVSGTVRALGPDVEGFAVGAPVTGRPIIAGFADVCVARAELVTTLQPDADDALLRRGAASFIAGCTAAILLEEVGRVRAGESLLVHGAAGAVGTALGQIARHLGLSPILGTVGAAWKQGFALANGYDEVFLREGFVESVRRHTAEGGVDFVADPIGGETRRESFSVLRPGGRLLAFGRTGTSDEGLLDGQTLRSKNWAFMGMSFGSLSEDDPSLSSRVVARVGELIRTGVIDVPLHEVLPFDRAEEALDLLASRGTTGKVLLKMKD